MRLALITCLVLASCGITAQQRAELINASAKAAGEAVEKELRAKLDEIVASELAKAKAGGATQEQLVALEKKLRSDAEAGILLARRDAEDRERALADRITPQAQPDSGGWFGKLLGILAPVATTFLLGLVRKDSDGA